MPDGAGFVSQRYIVEGMAGEAVSWDDDCGGKLYDGDDTAPRWPAIRYVFPSTNFTGATVPHSGVFLTMRSWVITT